LIEDAIKNQRELVLTCSALKFKYREFLNISPQVKFIWPQVNKNITGDRVESRQHFMPKTLLASQISTFEEPLSSEPIIIIDNSNELEITFENLFNEIIKRYPELNKAWWQRNK
jgi:gluconokinase